MKNVFIVSVLFLGVLYCANAQNGNEIESQTKFQDRIFVGGGISGLSFAKDYVYIGVAPMVGYRVTSRLSAGLGLSYSYVKSGSVKYHNYGLNPFVRFQVYDPFFAMAQYDFLSFDNGPGKPRTKFNTFLLGGGIQQPMGRNGSLYIYALYNFSYKAADPRPYGSPIVVGGGVSLGF